MIAIAIGRILTVLISIATLRLATQTLSPIEFGKWLLLNSLISFFVLYFISPIGHYINRHTHEWSENKTLVLNIKKFIFYLSFIAIMSALMLWIDAQTTRIIHADLSPMFYLLTGTGVFCLTLNQTLVPLLNMLEYRWAFTIASTLTGAFGLFLSLILSREAKTADYWLAGTLTANIIIAIATLMFLLKTVQNEVTKKPALSLNNLKNILSFSLPLLFVTGFSWIHTQGYRFFVESKLGLEQLAFFGAGYSVSAGLIAAVEGILNTYLIPIFYKNTHQDQAGTKAWPELMHWMILPILLAGFFIGIYAEVLIKLFLAAKYAAVVPYVKWGAFCEVLRVLNNSFQMLGHAEKNNKKLIFAFLTSPVIAFLFLFANLELYKAEAIGPSIAAGFLGCLIVLIFTYRNYTNQLLNKKNALSLFYLFVLLAALFSINKFITPLILSFILSTLVATIGTLLFLKPLLRNN